MTLDGSYLHHQSEREVKYFIEMEMDIFQSLSRIPNINFTIVMYRISLKIQILMKFHRILRKEREKEKYYQIERITFPPQNQQIHESPWLTFQKEFEDKQTETKVEESTRSSGFIALFSASFQPRNFPRFLILSGKGKNEIRISRNRN